MRIKSLAAPSLTLPFNLRSGVGIAIALAAFCESSHAISMRHDTLWNLTTSANPYIAEGALSLYNAVGFVQWTTVSGPYTGTGTLVQSSVPGQFKFLTAAHNVDSEGPGADGVIDAPNFTIFFGASTGDSGATATASVTVPASGVSVHSFWANGDGNGLTKGASRYDLAVLTFSLSAVTQGTLPTPMGVSFANPINQVGTMVGFGSWGNGQDFSGGGNPADGFRRAGKNNIDIVGNPGDNPANTGFTIQSDFDGPTGQGNTIGTSVSLALEASTAGGDSGGPLIAGGYVVGVLNGGFPGTGGQVSRYGDRSIWASLVDTSNQNFLTGAGIAPIPEPTSIALFGMAGLGLLLRRRR